MSEYTTINGKEYRRVYIVWSDGDEVGALLDEEAAEMLRDSIERAGVCDAWINCYIQPIERAEWLDKCMGLIRD